MKILFFIHSLGGGGAERVASILLNHFCEKHDTYVAILTQKDESYPIDSRVNVIDNIVKCKIKGAHRILKYRNIYRTIKEVNPDIILSFLVEMNGDTIITNLLTRKKIIVSERNSTQHNKTFKKVICRKLLYPFADKVVYVSQEECSKSKIKNKTYIYNPKNFDSFNDYKQRSKTIIAIGSQHKWHQKGFDLLINAWAKIESHHPDWKLEILGRICKSPIKSQIEKLGIAKRVEFLGSSTDVASVLKQKSIYVLSSRYEGFPNSLLEAMSQGCACIAFNCYTGPKEIITDGVSGILVEDGNVADLSEKMNLLMNNSELREKLSSGAVKESLRFDRNTIFSQWDELIESIVNNNI